MGTAKHVLRDHWHGRPPVLKVQTFLPEKRHWLFTKAGCLSQYCCLTLTGHVEFLSYTLMGFGFPVWEGSGGNGRHIYFKTPGIYHTGSMVVQYRGTSILQDLWPGCLVCVSWISCK